ncbi:DNA-deoxyinosine glycosylase [Clostridia bacterium]|nr:DNA-deoxyinosine glycosylase [Clostridia bacterium]
MHIYSFPYAAQSDARVLILGTMPSVASLTATNYYAHPRNAFWPIIYGLWDERPPEDWAARYEFLRSHRIALWDVACSCTRQASSDASMRDVQPNDIPALLDECPDIRAVFFNGQKAAALFRSLILPNLPDRSDRCSAIEFVTLPSTSPARVQAFETKAAAWRIVRAFLET